MNEEIEKTMKGFKESTFLEGGHSFPGFNYASGVRMSELTNAQLAFQKHFLEQYTNINREPLTETEIRDIERSKFMVYEELKLRSNKINKVHWPYIESPYFTLSEINSLSEEGRLIDKRHNISHGEIIPNAKNYLQKIQDLELKLKSTEDPDEISEIKRIMIGLGWNPEVDCTQENMSLAKERLEKIYTAEMNDFCTFIDNTDFIDKTTSTTVSENNIDKDFAPLFISIYENGTIKLYNSPVIDDSIGLADIYCIYLNKSIAEHVLSVKEMFEDDGDNAIFVMPSNYACYSVVKNIHEAYGFENRAIITKWHDVWNVDDNLDKIKNVCESFSQSSDTTDYNLYMSATVLS